MQRNKNSHTYTTVSNFLIDSSLSAEALGLILYLLSKPDGWIIRQADVRKRFAWGRTKARRVFSELCENSLLEYNKIQKEGNLLGSTYRLTAIAKMGQKQRLQQTDRGVQNQPLDNHRGVENQPPGEMPKTDKNGDSSKLVEGSVSRPSGNTTVGKPTPLVNTNELHSIDISIKDENLKKEGNAKKDQKGFGETNFFTFFWEEWKKAIPGTMQNARTENLLLKLSPADQTKIIQHLPKYLSQGFTIAPKPFNYVKGCKWTDPISSPQKASKGRITALGVDRGHVFNLKS